MAAPFVKTTVDDLIADALRGDMLCPRCGSHMMRSGEFPASEFNVCSYCYDRAHYRAMADKVQMEADRAAYDAARQRKSREARRIKAGKAPRPDARPPEVVDPYDSGTAMNYGMRGYL